MSDALALNVAFFVNAAILVMAAAVFYRNGVLVTEISQAHATLTPLVGTSLSAMLFAVALICVVGAHSGGSIQWVFSTTLLQMTVPDRFLGRVFALEMALLTLTMSVSTYVTGWGVDYPGLGARRMATILGLAFAVPGIAWLMLQGWLDRGDSIEGSRSLREAEPVTETSYPPG